MSRSNADRLKSYVNSLAQIDRYILLLVYADGLSAMEVSLVLDLSESVVRSRFEELRREAEHVLHGGSPVIHAAPADPAVGVPVSA